MKAILESLDGVPEALRSEYAQGADGKYLLKLEGDLPGFVPKARHDEINGKLVEFRSNNTLLLKERDALKQAMAQFEGMDPEEYKGLKAKAEALEKAGVKDPSKDIAALVAAQVAAAVGPLKQKLDAAEAEKAQANRAAADAALETALRRTAAEAGVADSALDDFVARGKRIFVLENGEPVAKKGDQPVFSQRNPGNPLSPTEWADTLVETAPHLFKPHKGGGAEGGGKGGSAPRVIGMDAFSANLEDIAKGKVRIAG